MVEQIEYDGRTLGKVEEQKRYTIRNHTMSGEPIVEGIATVTHVYDQAQDGDARAFCLVAFDDYPTSAVMRFVHPEDKVDE